MELGFSSEQEQIASIFTAYRNDIDIYTEDENKDKAFYKKLFTRLLNDSGIKINDVYPLGSSDDVIDACKKDNDTTRKKLYIVDGDIYIMFKPKEVIPNLYVLDAYCMENLVIDEESVCNTICDFHGEKEYDDIKTLFDFDNLIQEHQDLLITLFYYKSLDQKYRNFFNLYSLSKYYDKNNNLNPTIIESEKTSIKNRLISEGKISQEDFEKELLALESRFPKNKSTFLKIVSGKDYLIHMISCHAKKTLNHNTGHKKEAWKYNFARYCNLDRLQGLKNTILANF